MVHTLCSWHTLLVQSLGGGLIVGYLTVQIWGVQSCSKLGGWVVQSSNTSTYFAIINIKWRFQKKCDLWFFALHYANWNQVYINISILLMVHDFSIIEKKMVHTLCTWCTLLVQSWGGGQYIRLKWTLAPGLKTPISRFFSTFLLTYLDFTPT